MVGSARINAKERDKKKKQLRKVKKKKKQKGSKVQKTKPATLTRGIGALTMDEEKKE